MEPAVFLDRDNTLIANDGDIGDPELVHLIDGVPDALRSLRQAGYRLVVVTNQGGVARGRFTESDVDAVHQRIARLVDDIAGENGMIDRFYYCPYHPEGAIKEYRRDHPWRKPNPGMILQAARDMKLDLARSWVIGDNIGDVEAGRAAGCRTVLLHNGGDAADEHVSTRSAKTLSDAVAAILSHETAIRRPARRSDSAASTAIQSAPASVNDPPPSTSAADVQRGDQLRRAISELTEELRTERMRKMEFTPLKMAAGATQLLVVLLAMLAMLQVAELASFSKFMMSAVLAQLVTLTLLVLDQRA